MIKRVKAWGEIDTNNKIVNVCLKKKYTYFWNTYIPVTISYEVKGRKGKGK